MMGAPSAVASYSSRPLADCFAASGFNSGNLLIGNGLAAQLDATLVQYADGMSPGYIDEHFDIVAIAAANFLYPGFDLSPLSSVLEKTSRPVFMAGLGAQLPSANHELTDIPEGTWRLVRLVAERSAAIGVRGYFTAELLRKNGIDNVRVVGCPSLYTTLLPAMRLKVDPVGLLDRVVFNGSRNVIGHSFDPEAARRVERALLQKAMQLDAPFVFQNEQPEIEVASGEDPASHAEALAALAVSFDCDMDALVAYYQRRGKVFFSIPEWFDWIAQFGLSIGTRFHGNIAALLNGVPAIVIVHDSRTRELCEVAAIPHVSVTDVGDLDIERLFDEADFALCEERYNTLFRRYVDFLTENGLPHKLVYALDLPPRGRISPSRVGSQP
jgi:hypothetical protein